MHLHVPSFPHLNRVRRRHGVLFLAAIALAAPVAARTIVPIGNVGELYDHVNNPGYAGALLVLAGGSYPLDAARANCGRIELQPDMGIVGVAGQPDQVVIDASALYPKVGDPHACPDAAKTAAIRLGRGNNSLESLRVTGAINAAAAIGTDLESSAARVRIANVIVDNSARGIDVRNYLASARALDVTLTGNVLRNNAGKPGQGLRVANIGAAGSSIRVTMSGNAIYANVVGCLVANLNGSGSAISVTSSSDAIYGNGNGCLVNGGIVDATSAIPAAANASGNAVSVSFNGGRISGNTLPPGAASPSPGGLVVIGGQSNSTVYAASRNAVSVTVKSSILDDNPPQKDAVVMGALPDTSGTGNSVLVDLRYASGTPETTLVTSASNPALIRR